MKPLMIITGSSGLIGANLCHHFADDYTVIGFDREGGAYPPEIVDWLFVDLSSDESVQNGMHIVAQRYGKQISSVIHLAAYYDFAGEKSPLYEEITVNGTERLLRDLQRFDVEQFIFSSTMLVHRPTSSHESINEDSPIEPTWQYPESKVKTEELILSNHGEMSAVIMRIAGVYDDMCHSIPIAHQIKRTFESDITSHFYPGDFKAGQSFVHLDDLVTAFDLAVSKRNTLQQELTLLIGEDDVLSFEETQTIIANELNRSDWLAKIPKPVAKMGAMVQGVVTGEDSFIKPWMIDRTDDTYRLDISRAKQTLGWHPQRRLRNQLPEMIERFKRDPVRWYQINGFEPPHWLLQRAS